MATGQKSITQSVFDTMDDKRFILEVEKHKILYDITDPFYKDNARKDKAWNLIGGVLGVDGEYKLLISL